MSKGTRSATLLLAALFFLPAALWAGADRDISPAEIKDNKTNLYKDIFDQNIYYDLTSYLRLDRLYRKVTGKKSASLDVNLYDEVPDGTLFINRHARSRMSASELEKGYQETGGPDVSGRVTITEGKGDGLNVGFFGKDSKGEKYLFKFDPPDNFEMITAADVVASRFYYALGYNVPENNLVQISLEQLDIGEGAEAVDHTGFSRPLTQKWIDEKLVFVPPTPDGKLQAITSKLISGEYKGRFSFLGRRRSDPLDKIPHERMRAVRALRVFGSWLNNHDVRMHNTLDALVNENGRTYLKHYILDLSDSFGGTARSPKPPMATYEYMVDYGEGMKAILGLGLWEKPWQKKFREGGEKSQSSPALGYFDNRYFDPGNFKIQLPHYAFKDLTRADGFWAAKQIMVFTDEEIRAMVKAGRYSDPKDEERLAHLLAERRDMIGRYWFSQAAPLDGFRLRGGRLEFEDLAVAYGFAEKDTSVYQIKAKTGRKKNAWEQKETSIEASGPQEFWIRVKRPADKEFSPYVWVRTDGNAVTGIRHQD